MELRRQAGAQLSEDEQRLLNGAIYDHLEKYFSPSGKDGTAKLDDRALADKFLLTREDFKELHDRFLAVREERTKEAVELLSKHKKPNAERALVEMATGDIEHSPTLARLAKEFEQKWTSEQQKPMNEQSISPLFVGDVLQKISNQLEALSWPENTKDAAKIYNQWLEAQKDAVNNPAAIEKVEQLRERLNTINAEREKFLNDNLRPILKAAGINLPKFELKVVQEINRLSTEAAAAAEYHGGTGKIEILESKIISDNHLDPELVGVLSHEVAHHEQNILVIRKLADELENNKQIDKDRLRLRYYQDSGRSLDEKFLENILQWRDKDLANKHLTQGENERAETLIRSDGAKDDYVRIQRQLTQLRPYTDAFNSDRSIRSLLEVKDSQQRKAKLEGILEKVPNEVAQDLKILDEAQKSGAPQVKELYRALSEKLKKEFKFKKEMLIFEREQLYYNDSMEREAFTAGHRGYFFAKLHQRRR